MIFIDLPAGRMPALGVGTLSVGDGDCAGNVLKALELGYRHIDTAQAYRNESGVGKGIRESRLPRSELFVTTKLWMTDYAAPRAKLSVDASLERLGLDYVDLLLMHWPSEEVPMEETLGVLLELRAAGRVRDIGVSNFTKAQMRRAQSFAKGLIACNQLECHVFLRQEGVRAVARELRMAAVAYSPLARGKVAEDAVLAAIATRLGRTPTQVALRWIIEQGLAAIPKSVHAQRLADNFAVFDFELSAADRDAIAKLPAVRTINPSFAPVWDGD